MSIATSSLSIPARGASARRSRRGGAPTRALLRAYFGIVSRLAPPLARRHAERLFTTPPGYAGRVRQPVPARRETVVAGRHDVAVWEAGPAGAPAVLLVHGWGGRGTQLGAFVAPLVARGFSVVTFDAPGHGASDDGVVTIPEMTAAIHAAAASRGPLAGLVAHSAGALTATAALSEGLDVDAAVFVAPPAELVGAAARFTETLGFSRPVRERMRERIATRLGRPWSAFDVIAQAASLTAPLLVVHDHGDLEVPWQQGMAITRAWRGAEMLMTDGLGHRRILRDPDVVATAVAFVAARTAEHAVAERVASAALEATPLEALLAG
jgi:pimeloyl-ACP methyl ester carboxylesterase